MWCSAVQNAPTLPPSLKTMSKPASIRLTITVTPEVHSAFERLSKASSMSMSRCMGEWLGDTLDAVEYTASLVERARAAPKLVMKEVHAYALGLADETGAVLQAVRRDSALLSESRQREAVASVSGALGEPYPPPCNTGGKVPHKGGKRGGKKHDC